MAKSCSEVLAFVWCWVSSGAVPEIPELCLSLARTIRKNSLYGISPATDLS